MRVVIAVEPSIEVAERLVLLQEDLADSLHALGVDAVWTRGDELRLILRVADLDEGELGYARATVREHVAPLKPFRIETRGSTFLPDDATPRLLAVDTGDGDEHLTILRDAVQTGLSRLALPEEPTPWRPLIRVGRMKTSHASNPLTGVLRRFSDTSYGHTDVTSLIITTSELVDGRVRTRLVDRLPLAG